jgi:hypothetical protein
MMIVLMPSASGIVEIYKEAYEILLSPIGALIQGI